jgi:hypothetical protein
MEFGAYYSKLMSNLMLVLSANCIPSLYLSFDEEDEMEQEAATWARLGSPAGGHLLLKKPLQC